MMLENPSDGLDVLVVSWENAEASSRIKRLIQYIYGIALKYPRNAIFSLQESDFISFADLSLGLNENNISSSLEDARVNSLFTFQITRKNKNGNLWASIPLFEVLFSKDNLVTIQLSIYAHQQHFNMLIQSHDGDNFLPEDINLDVALKKINELSMQDNNYVGDYWMKIATILKESERNRKELFLLKSELIKLTTGMNFRN